MEERWRRETAGEGAVAGTGLRLTTPRSHCLRCRQPIPWHGLIPLAGFALLGGRCASCARRDSRPLPAHRAPVRSGDGMLRLAVRGRLADRRSMRADLGAHRSRVHRSRVPAPPRHDHPPHALVGPRVQPGRGVSRDAAGGGAGGNDRLRGALDRAARLPTRPRPGRPRLGRPQDDGDARCLARLVGAAADRLPSPRSEAWRRDSREAAPSPSGHGSPSPAGLPWSTRKRAGTRCDCCSRERPEPPTSQSFFGLRRWPRRTYRHPDPARVRAAVRRARIPGEAAPRTNETCPKPP